MNRQYRQYLKSPQWQELRRKVFQRALSNAGSNNLHGVCERCGYQPWKPILQLHHLTYENIFHEKLDDLILLCPNCHKAESQTFKNQKQEKESEEQKMGDNLSFNIEKHIAVIGTSGGSGKVQKELNIVRWGDNPPKFDLRAWAQNHERGYKGISLSEDEILALREALNKMEL